MATIEQLYEAFGQVNLRQDLPELIEQTGNHLELLIIGQLEKGQMPDGGSIQPSYASNYYAKQKFSMNSLPGYGVPDIKKSGKYYAATKVTAKGDEYDVESDTPYANADSITQYGDILLPSDENKQIYCDDTLMPAIANYILEKTGIVLT